MEKENKRELLERAKNLAEKHDELKVIITNMLDEMDKIELKYLEIIDKIKQK